ncbi:MAG: signal recognition particle-docking protein FtsY [Zetaproteobacteria bacterium]|nr:signal recognition particle-docking protein FtsY [Zetaproteobacteria bacterium]
MQGIEGIEIVVFQFIFMMCLATFLTFWLGSSTPKGSQNLLKKFPQKLSPPRPQPEALTTPQTVEVSWTQRLTFGLKRTRGTLTDKIAGVLGAGVRLDQQVLEQIHEVLYRADLGVDTADLMIARLQKALGESHEVNWDQAKQVLAKICLEIFAECESVGKAIEPGQPHITLVIGVNGVGKTTTIGKLAALGRQEGRKVLLGAADTYRAAAVEQLKVWAERAQVDLVSHTAGADPAAVAFDTVKAAASRGCEKVYIDTAGRLHNKKDLMNELDKIQRVIRKEVAEAPHEVWLVVDATTGQNALRQVAAFSEVAEITGIVVTKLDGTAKGGVLISIAEKFKKPVKYIGIGEGVEDLRVFEPIDYVQALFAT